MKMATHESARTLTQTKLFIGVLVLGALSILVGKLFPGRLAFAIFAILMPIALMLAYAFFNYRAGFLDSTRAQVADNSYYLGFLFFLVSLAITLAQVSASSESRVEVEPIIRGFGVALATTIVGLFLRIVILQNIAGLTSARERAEESLLNAVNRFERQIEVSLDLFAKSRDHVLTANASTTDSVKRTLVELAEATKQATDAATKGYVDGLLTASRTTTNELEAALANFKTKVQGLNLPSNALTAAIAPHLAELEKVLADLNLRTADVKVGVGFSASQIKKVGPGLAKLSDALATQINGIEEFLGRARASQEAMRGLDERVQRAAGALEQLAVQVAQTSQGLQKVPEVSGRAGVAWVDAEKAAQALKDAVSATVVSVRNDARAFGQAAGDLRASTQEVVNSMRTAITEMQGAVQALRVDVRKFREDMESSSVSRPWWRIGGG